jgi:hypothetical protein
MTGLADLDPDAGTRAGASILRLFDAAPVEAPRGLTDWDRAFLRALYTTEQKNLRQRALIAGRMLAALSR